LVVLTLALLIVALALPACGGSNDDQAMVERLFAAWSNKDVAAIQEMYATDAVLHQPELYGGNLSGVQAISDQAKSSLNEPTLLGKDVLTWVPSDEEAKALTGLFGKAAGARFLAAPTLDSLGKAWMTILEVRDGKIVNEWDTEMTR